MEKREKQTSVMRESIPVYANARWSGGCEADVLVGLPAKPLQRALIVFKVGCQPVIAALVMCLRLSQ